MAPRLPTEIVYLDDICDLQDPDFFYYEILGEIKSRNSPNQPNTVADSLRDKPFVISTLGSRYYSHVHKFEAG
jgi:hypothetical protein